MQGFCSTVARNKWVVLRSLRCIECPRKTKCCQLVFPPSPCPPLYKNPGCHASTSNTLERARSGTVFSPERLVAPTPKHPHCLVCPPASFSVGAAGNTRTGPGVSTKPARREERSDDLRGSPRDVSGSPRGSSGGESPRMLPSPRGSNSQRLVPISPRPISPPSGDERPGGLAPVTQRVTSLEEIQRSEEIEDTSLAASKVSRKLRTS